MTNILWRAYLIDQIIRLCSSGLSVRIGRRITLSDYVVLDYLYAYLYALAGVLRRPVYALLVNE